MKIIVFGATGLIGSECVRQAIEDKGIEQITIIARRNPDDNLTSDKLNVIIHTDFLDYSALLDTFANHEGCIWALGTSQNTVKEDEYIKITHDYTIAAAKAIASVNSDMRFVFISGMGADPNEQSRFLYGRIKGKTENNLVKETGLKETYTVRPGAVMPSQTMTSKAWYERAILPFLHVMNFVKPSWVITSAGLARAVLYLLKHGHHATLFENQDIKDLLNDNHLIN